MNKDKGELVESLNVLHKILLKESFENLIKNNHHKLYSWTASQVIFV